MLHRESVSRCVLWGGTPLFYMFPNLKEVGGDNDSCG